jgi:putative ABC transport system permease protein
MTRTRWRKVLADLWSNKARTILTVLTIIIGVFTIGFVTALNDIILSDTDAFYASANPHSAVIYTDPLDESAIDQVKKVSGVTEIEGRTGIMARLIGDNGKKYDIGINEIPPLSDMNVDLLHSDSDLPGLKDGEIWMERSSAQLFPVNEGDILEMQLQDGQMRELRVAGIVQDASSVAANYSNSLTGFVTQATVESFGGPALDNVLLVVVDDHTKDEDLVNNVVGAINGRLNESGHSVYGSMVYNPGEHFSREIFSGITAVLGILGWVVVVLSTFLVINTINSLLSQHVRQIGIMKVVGGSRRQIIGMYMVFILAYGLLALLIAVPLSAFAAYAACGGMSRMINISLGSFRLIPQAVLIQAITALIVPLAAAAVPVLIGTRIPVRDAIDDYGVKNGHFGHSLIDRLVEKVRFFSRPVLLSLRNTFRRKGRIALTLAALTLGGAIFIAVFNLWGSFGVMLDKNMGYSLTDINVYLSEPYPADDIEQLILDVPGVTGVESWGHTEAQILSDDGSESKPISITAPPADSSLIQPIITEGRWLEPGDEDGLVIGNHLLDVRPDLGLGDKVVIDIAGKETAWTIVGVFKLTGNTSPPPVYTTNENLDKYMPEPGTTISVRITTTVSDADTQLAVSKALETAFNQNDIKFNQMVLASDWAAQQASSVNVIIYFLLVMAVLIAIVGGIGLAGMMGMNVLERTREIGVLRAVGARSGSVMRMVVLEGVIIGFLSWLLALVFSLPLTLVLNYGVGQALFNQNLGFFVVDWQGVAGWIAGSLAVASLASLVPAARATRLTIRDVLAYE